MLSVMEMLQSSKSSADPGETGGLLDDVMHYLRDVSEDPNLPHIS
jgi:uncharacterized protein (UPF0147 family)